MALIWPTSALEKYMPLAARGAVSLKPVSLTMPEEKGKKSVPRRNWEPNSIQALPTVGV
jgi:hypothetical protein